MRKGTRHWNSFNKCNRRTCSQILSYLSGFSMHAPVHGHLMRASALGTRSLNIVLATLMSLWRIAWLTSMPNAEAKRMLGECSKTWPDNTMSDLCHVYPIWLPLINCCNHVYETTNHILFYSSCVGYAIWTLGTILSLLCSKHCQANDAELISWIWLFPDCNISQFQTSEDKTRQLQFKSKIESLTQQCTSLHVAPNSTSWFL